MRSRCLNKNNPAFDRYGGRGIYLCERWLDPKNFMHDMGQPIKGLTLERIDNDGPYSPENCRWATRAEQNNNKRNVRNLEIEGITKTLAEWSAESGIPRKTIWYRLKDGWPTKQAVFAQRTPQRFRRGQRYRETWA